jgi:outer membrane protein OmpA-like peptidoglycan-associated protein
VRGPEEVVATTEAKEGRGEATGGAVTGTVRAEKARGQALPTEETTSVPGTRPERAAEVFQARPVTGPEKTGPVVPSRCRGLVTLRKTAPEEFVCETEFYFDFNSFGLDTEALEKLQCALDTVKGSHIKHLYIEGHSCAHGPETYNLVLSAKRAMRVKRYIQRKLHLPDSLIEVKAFGEFKLKFPEIPTPENKYDPEVRMNRRVVLRIEFVREKVSPSSR